MLKVFKTFSVALLIYLLSVSGAWADATLSLANPDSPDGKWEGVPGSTATITLSLTTDTPIRGSQFDIQIGNTDYLDITNVAATAGGPIATFEVNFNLDFTNDAARILFFDYAADSTNVVTAVSIIDLSIQVDENAPDGAEVPITIVQNSDIVVKNGGVMVSETVGTNFVINAGGGEIEYPVDFVANWNLFGLPIDPAVDYDSYSFLQDCSDCTQIAKYEDGAFLAAVDLGGGFVVGEQFNLTESEGYFVYLNANQTFTFTGTSFADHTVITYDNGWNLISLPNSDGTSYDSYTILQTIPECNQIAKYEDGAFLAAVDLGGGFVVGEQFNLEQHGGYFLACTSAGTWPATGRALTTSRSISADSPAALKVLNSNFSLVSEKPSVELEKASAHATQKTLQTRAVPDVSELVVSNPREDGVTVSWYTEDVSSSRVDYGATSGNLDLNLEDATQVEVHQLDVEGLAEFTEYFYTASSQNNDGTGTTEESTFKSAKALGTSTPYIAAARVFDNNQVLFQGAIVYLQIKKSSGETSWVESAVTAANGGFTIDMNAARNPANGEAFGPAVGDSAKIWVQGGSAGVFEGWFEIPTGFLNAGDLVLTPRPGGQANFIVSSEAIDFGAVTIGQLETETVTITNNGDAAGQITSITSNNGDFTTDFTVAVNLDPNSSQDVVVTYTPTAVETDNGTLTIATDANGLAVALTGVGTSAPVADFTISPDQFDFGSVNVGEQATTTVTLTNVGGAAGTILTVVSSNVDFTTDFIGQVAVAPGETQDVVITYAPTAAETDNAVLTVTTDVEVLTVNLSGTGVQLAPEFAFSPTSLDFGTVTVGNTVEETFTITNNGTADLVIESIVMQGGGPYSITDPSFPLTIPADASRLSRETRGSRVITVQFAPVATGEFNEVAVITHNAAGSPANLSLTGIGADQPQPHFAVSSTAIDFGDIIVGMSVTQTFTVTNDGDADGQITDVQISGEVSFSTDFSGGPTMVPQDGTIDVNVTYTPTAAGDHTGTATVATNANSPTVTLSGSAGIQPVLAIGDGSGTPNQDATVDLTLDNAIAIASVQLTIDADALTLGDVTVTNRATGLAVITNASEGTIIIGPSAGVSIAAGTGAIATINFTVNTDACAGDHAVDFVSSTLTAVDATDVPHATTNGQFSVLQTAALIEGPDELEFPGGDDIEEKTIYIHNTALACQGETLDITSIFISNDDDLKFSVTSPTEFSVLVDAGDSTPVVIHFDRDDETPGTFTADLNIISSVGDISVDLTGTINEIGIDIILPTSYRLAQNYPNPFNPFTTIQFDVPENSDISLRIYNTNGQLVRVLFEGSVNQGTYNKVWNAKDDYGQEVTSGLYFYRLETEGNFTTTKRMMLMK
ncbi:MAG: hypothetical protein B6244_04795 [Candidatus Cloacimonetes bacterium 4572_55]|nr:MAG: hypothetical protein B6244_04795 [Candidatus Cloacimonetes bacterium 4572_55]